MNSKNQQILYQSTARGKRAKELTRAIRLSLRGVVHWVFLFVFVVLLCGGSGESKAQTGDGSVRWMQMETPHFLIYYPHGLYAFALRVARLSEEAHEVLMPYAQNAPQGRTHVLLLNNTDDSNGAATALPRNTVYLFVAPPEGRGVLHDSDDWLRGLIYHEYLHILHLDTMSQIYRIVNLVLGKIFAPNMLMPRWWIEGWATYVETAYTGGGRGRSSLFDAYMRSAILTGKLLNLSQVSNVTVEWPRGTSAYLYGSRFLTYIAEKYGKKKLTEIAHVFGAMLFPYGMNLATKQVLQKKNEQLWQEWIAHLRKKYEAEAKHVKKYPLTRAKQLTKGGEWLGIPRYTRDGKHILSYRVNGYSPDRIEKIERSTGRTSTLLLSNGFAQISLSRDGTMGILSQTEAYKGVYFFNDLFSFSPRNGSTQRLTYGERAKDPSISPDGKEVVYVRHRGGQTALWIYNLKRRTKRHFYTPPLHAVLSSPRYSPNGQWIVCSTWLVGGNRDLFLISRRSGKVQRLTNTRAQDIEPTFTPDGQEIVYTSDTSGIYNLYAMRISDRRIRRLTNELYGAFAPAISPDGRHIAYARFGPQGLDLAEMPFPTQETPYPMPTLRKKWPRMKYPMPRQIYPVRPYSIWPTILPQTWLPILSADYAGQTIGLRFNGTDILGFHAYDVSLTYGIESREVSYNLSYRYSQLYPSFSLTHSRFARTSFGALAVNGKELPIQERVTSGSVGIDVPLIWWRANHFFFMRYELSYLEPINLQISFRPDDIPPRIPEFGLLTQLSFGWSFSNVLSYGRSISAEQGRSIFLQVRIQHPYLGSIGEVWGIDGGWNEYIPMPWAKGHVLALGLAAGIGRSSFRVRRLYFLGGIPTQDFFQSALSGNRIGGGYLRGYPAFRFAGDALLLLQTEYRFPLLDLERGLGVGPAFLRRIHFAFFVDTGQTFAEPYTWNQFEQTKVGVGAELRIETLIGYYLSINIRFGFAKGLMPGGIDHLYFILGSSF